MTRRRPPGMHREHAGPRSDAAVAAHRVIAEGPMHHEGTDDASKPVGDVATENTVTEPVAPTVRKSTYERRRALKCQTLGTLDGESSLIAKRVQQLACTSDVVVWAHGEQIFVASANSAAKVLAELMIGVYGAGVLLAEIEDDMRSFRLRRSGT